MFKKEMGIITLYVGLYISIKKVTSVLKVLVVRPIVD